MKRILIVEDNPDLRDLLTIVIRRLGHEVATAITGEEAVEHAAAIKPDLILMDIVLPKLNGVEATKRIKADPVTKNVPVVILTALSIPLHGSNAIESGAVEILQKPVHVAALEQVVTKYLYMEDKAATKPSEDSVSGKQLQQTSTIRH